jgi:hypothetical protein
MAKIKSAETPGKIKNRARQGKKSDTKQKAAKNAEEIKRRPRPPATAVGNAISTHIQANLQKLEKNVSKLVEYISLGGSVIDLPPGVLQSAKMNIQTLIDMTTVAEIGGIAKVKEVLIAASAHHHASGSDPLIKPS